jgi:hypothetical protein
VPSSSTATAELTAQIQVWPAQASPHVVSMAAMTTMTDLTTMTATIIPVAFVFMIR